MDLVFEKYNTLLADIYNCFVYQEFSEKLGRFLDDYKIKYQPYSEVEYLEKDAAIESYQTAFTSLNSEYEKLSLSSNLEELEKLRSEVVRSFNKLPSLINQKMLIDKLDAIRKDIWIQDYERLRIVVLQLNSPDTLNMIIQDFEDAINSKKVVLKQFRNLYMSDKIDHLTFMSNKDKNDKEIFTQFLKQ